MVKDYLIQIYNLENNFSRNLMINYNFNFLKWCDEDPLILL